MIKYLNLISYTMGGATSKREAKQQEKSAMENLKHINISDKQDKILYFNKDMRCWSEGMKVGEESDYAFIMDRFTNTVVPYHKRSRAISTESFCKDEPCIDYEKGHPSDRLGIFTFSGCTNVYYWYYSTDEKKISDHYKSLFDVTSLLNPTNLYQPCKFYYQKRVCFYLDNLWNGSNGNTKSGNGWTYGYIISITSNNIQIICRIVINGKIEIRQIEIKKKFYHLVHDAEERPMKIDLLSSVKVKGKDFASIVIDMFDDTVILYGNDTHYKIDEVELVDLPFPEARPYLDGSKNATVITMKLRE